MYRSYCRSLAGACSFIIFTTSHARTRISTASYTNWILLALVATTYSNY